MIYMYIKFVMNWVQCQFVVKCKKAKLYGRQQDVPQITSRSTKHRETKRYSQKRVKRQG